MADGIRIDALPPTIAASKEHVVPSMRDGITVKLSVGQINDLGRLATALESGTDFDDITSPGLYAVTSDVNAPLGGGRWLVACNTDPDDASSVFQTAMLLSGGMAALTFTRRSVAGVFGAWSGGPSAAYISFDDAVAFPGATNVQQALEMSAAWIGDIRDVLTPQEFVAGLTLSNNAGDPNNKIDIAPGRARGSGVTVEISSTITKRLDANWSEGDGEGGLDTGSKAANATYHVFVIRKDDDGTGDVLFSTSATSPTVPVGWTRVQRLGAVLTDASGNIWPFVQSGNTFFFNAVDGISVYSSTTTRAKAPLSVVVPNGVRVQGLFLAVLNTAGSGLVARMLVYDGLYTNVRDAVALRSSSGEATIILPTTAFTNTSQQIQLEVTDNPHASSPCALRCRGWIDYQIPRIG